MKHVMMPDHTEIIKRAEEVLADKSERWRGNTRAAEYHNDRTKLARAVVELGQSCERYAKIHAADAEQRSGLEQQLAEARRLISDVLGKRGMAPGWSDSARKFLEATK